MDRRTKICIWIIILGLVNFLIFTMTYVIIGGDAMKGDIRVEITDQGKRILHYFLVGEGRGRRFEVSRGVWIYSAIHSISLWITMGAVMLSMLTLAKDRIVASMQTSIIRGRTFITVLATLVTLISIVFTIWFVAYMIRQLIHPAPLGVS